MASIIKRGKGWSVRWVDIDGANRRRQCPNKKTATALKLQIESDHALGKDWAPTSKTDATLAEVIRAFLKFKKLRVKESTYTVLQNRMVVFLHWVEQVENAGKTQVSSCLSRSLLNSYSGHIAAPKPQGRGCERSTVTAMVNGVEHLWSWAYSEDVEAWKIQRPKKLGLKMPQPETVKAPTFQQLDCVIALLNGRSQRYAILCRYTGLRVGQVQRLKWADIDFDLGEIHIRPELGKSEQESTGRYMPLHSSLLGLLKGPTFPREDEYLVKMKPGRISRYSINRAWVKSGLDPKLYKKHPFHSFRKGFRTFMEVSGVPLRVVDFLVGHSSGHVSSRYVDPQAFGLRQAIELIPPIILNRAIDEQSNPIEVSFQKADGDLIGKVGKAILIEAARQTSPRAKSVFSVRGETQELWEVWIRKL